MSGQPVLLGAASNFVLELGECNMTNVHLTSPPSDHDENEKICR